MGIAGCGPGGRQTLSTTSRGTHSSSSCFRWLQEEGVLEPRRRGPGEQEEDGPEHEQLGGQLILQGSLTESPACPEDTHQEELGVTEGNGLTNCETKDSPAIPTKEEGLREGDNPPDDPHSLGSTPGQDNSIQDQEGDTGQQGEDTMGKSSRAPSPKKLVVSLHLI